MKFKIRQISRGSKCIRRKHLIQNKNKLYNAPRSKPIRNGAPTFGNNEDFVLN